MQFINMKKILIAAGILLALQVFRKARAAYNFTYTLADLSIGGNLLNPELIIKIAIRNNESQPVKFNYLSGTVSINNTQIGNVDYLGTGVTIAGNQTTFVNLRLSNFNPDILGRLRELIRRPLRFGFSGTVGAENINFPVQFSYQW